MSTRLFANCNFDADESMFFLRELEKIKAKTFDKKYGELKARSLIPVSNEAGPGAESITYRQYDQLGVAKLIANYADDLPRTDVKGKEFSQLVKSIGDSYGYNIQELRAARMVGKPLEQRRANSAKRAHLQLENDLAFFGDSASGFAGFLNNANVPIGTLPADGAGSAVTFVSKTPDQVIRDMNSVANSILTTTKGVESGDTLVLPLSIWTYVSTTARSANSDTTILEYFLKNSPSVKNVEWLTELETAGVGSTKRMVVYRRDEDHLTLEVPQDFEQFPVQERGLEFIIPCHARFGGVLWYYPLSAAYADGI